MKIMVEFIMFAEDFPVDDIVEKISIPNSEIEKKGDIIYYGQNKDQQRVETHSSILYSTGYIETIDVKEPIEKICKVLFPRVNQVAECVEKYKLSAKFCVIINLTENPIIELSHEFIALASKIHAKIEFDSYVNYDKDGNIISC